jgi:hypothetical protein
MKKELIMFLMVLFIFALSACRKTEEPIYGNPELTMHIGAWVAPPNFKDDFGNYRFITPEHYQNIADSGINVIYGLYEAGDMEAIALALDMAEMAGIGYYIYHWTLKGLFQDIFDGLGNPISEDMAADIATLEQIMAPFKDHPAFKGNMIIDEPGAAPFKGLGIYHQIYREMFPDKDFYVNLFPTYSSLSQRDGRSYVEYIQEFIDLVNPEFLSYDHYPLMVFYDQPVLTDDYLLNLDFVSEMTKEAGIPFWLFIQTIGYTTVSGTQARRPNEADVRWQVGVSKAFGAQGIQHFTYWTPGTNNNESFTDAMIDRDGNKTDLYYAVQKVNHEVLFYDHVYLSFDWQGVMTYSPDANEPHVNFRMLGNPITSHKRIRSLNADEHTLIGVFKNENNVDGFMVVNYNDPALAQENTVTIRFNEAKHAIIYHQGERHIVNLNRGVLNLDLEAGDYAFVIPY